MQYYVQFMVDNTDKTKLVSMLGSNGVRILDARFNLNNKIQHCFDFCEKHIAKNRIRGFQIIKAQRFSDEGKLIYNHEFNNLKSQKING